MTNNIRNLECIEGVDDGELQTEKKVKKARVMRCSIKTHNAQGEEVFNLETAVAICEKYKSIKRYAIILHDKDVYTSKDVVLYNRKHPEAPRNVGAQKDDHIHIVLDLGTSQYVDMVASWFDIPANLMYVASGKGAFLDCVEYLTHEHPNQQEQGKTLYPDEEVIANFDFRKALNERHAKREKYGRDDVSLKDMLRYEVTFNGLTIKQLREKYPFEYIADMDKLKKCRSDYLFNKPTPPYRMNIYIGGENGGIGKGLFGKALVKKMIDPYDIMEGDEIYFSVTKGNLFNKYAGQPVLLWEDFRSYELLKLFENRGELYNFLSPYPAKGSGIVDVKFDNIKLANHINIFDSIQNPEDWLNGLAGEYTDKEGKFVKSEETLKEQSHRRFPLAFWIVDDNYQIYLNKSFLEGTREYTQWLISEEIPGNFQELVSHMNEKQYNECAQLLISPAVEEASRMETIMKNRKPDMEENELNFIKQFLGKRRPTPQKYTTVEEALEAYQNFNPEYKLGAPVYFPDLPDSSEEKVSVEDVFCKTFECTNSSLSQKKIDFLDDYFGDIFCHLYLTKTIHPVYNECPEYPEELYYEAEENHNEYIQQTEAEAKLIDSYLRFYEQKYPKGYEALQKEWSKNTFDIYHLRLLFSEDNFKKWQKKAENKAVFFKEMLLYDELVVLCHH